LALLKQAGDSAGAQWESLTQADDAVAVQMVSVIRQSWPDTEQANLESRIREAAIKRPIFRDYIESPLPPIKISAGQLK
jgi:hypothetical protein